jgi:hypothetical protein
MILYHGTGDYSLQSLLRLGPRLSSRHYLRGRKAFSSTTDFSIAALFAIRHSTLEGLRTGRGIGVVVEYELHWNARGADWTYAKDSGILQDEKEVAIFNPKVLDFLAVWYLEDSEWVRHHAGEPLKVYVP